jgi:putative hemolysin
MRAGRRGSAESTSTAVDGMNRRSFTSGRTVFIGAALFVSAFLLLQATVFAEGPGAGVTAQSSDGSWRDAIVVAVLVFVTALFVLAETALLTVRRTRIEQLVEENNRAAKQVAELLAEPTRMLATLQVGLTLVQLFSAGEAANRFVGPFERALQTRFANGFISSHAGTIAFVTIILTVGLATLIIGEIAPKSLAIRHAESIALAAARPLKWLQVVTAPLVSIVTFFSGLIVRAFGGTVSFHASPYSEEELKIMVEQSEEHGVIETEEKQMIHNVFEFADTSVHEVMTPRPEISAVEADEDVEKLLQVVTESGHSRLPVYDDDLDNIVGIVHVKDVLRALTGEQRAESIRELARPAYFIPDTKRVDDLLTDFKRQKTQIAIVQDEYGTVTGVVTIEDLLEEIVGEIQDEYDQEEPSIVNAADGTCVVDGKMNLREFNDRMGVELPIEETNTVGGFVFGLLGHRPDVGEAARWDGVEFTIDAMDGTRIHKVRVVKRHQDDSGDGVPDSSGDGLGAGPGDTASAETDRVAVGE